VRFGQGAPQSPQAYEDDLLAAIATAADIPDLKTASWPVGYREIRIRSEQSMVCCESRPFLRLVQGPGDIRGSLWLFRTLLLRPGNPLPGEDERCEPYRDQHVCVRQWTLAFGDWASVAARLDESGAWAIADPCPIGRVVRGNDGSISFVGGIIGDAGLLSVQRRVASTFSSFLCFAPGLPREGDGSKAQAIYEYFVGLTGAVPSEPIRIAK